jgi:hypothetical protein
MVLAMADDRKHMNGTRLVIGEFEDRTKSLFGGQHAHTTISADAFSRHHRS